MTAKAPRVIKQAAPETGSRVAKYFLIVRPRIQSAIVNSTNSMSPSATYPIDCGRFGFFFLAGCGVALQRRSSYAHYNSGLQPAEIGMRTKKNRTDAFARELCNALNRGEQTPWTCKATTLKGTHERADVVLIDGQGQTQVLVEVELRRGNPVVNVVKTWQWAKQPRQSRFKAPILVHAFSGYYKEKRTWLTYAKFIGAQMEKDCDIKYVPLRFGYRPRKNRYSIGGAGRSWARRLARRILKALKKHGWQLQAACSAAAGVVSSM
jgi:hypothetical protein